ncbi:hypothetical protein [Nitratireductor sp. XY-223]|nr:hypothetical protein [Nitratireductor sp. XY-223]
MTAIREAAVNLRLRPLAGILPMQRTRIASEIIAGFTPAAPATKRN